HRLDELCGVLLGAAADLADHHDSPRSRIRLEELERVEERRSYDRVPTDPDSSRLPEPQRGELEDGLVRERPAARDDPDGARLVDVAGHDPDLALPGRDDAGTVGADEPR